MADANSIVLRTLTWPPGRRHAPPKRCLLAKNGELQRIVAAKLKEDWAPQQIAGWLKDEYPENPELWVSHETIYRSLFVQARGVLKKELIGYLRSKRSIRRSRHATARGERETLHWKTPAHILGSSVSMTH